MAPGKVLWGDVRESESHNVCPPPSPVEVTDPVSIKAAAARVEGLLKGSGLHLLINNAGIVKKTTLEAETPEYMSQVYATNTTGPLVISQVSVLIKMTSLVTLVCVTEDLPFLQH